MEQTVVALEHGLARLVHLPGGAGARRHDIPVVDVVIARRRLAGRVAGGIEDRERRIEGLAVVVPQTEIESDDIAEAVRIVDVGADASDQAA